MSNFTGILADIEEIIGTADTLKLAHDCGGTTVFIPKKPRAEMLLSQIIGLENVKKLSLALGQGEILIPMSFFRGIGLRRVRIAQLLDHGLTVQKIAQQIEVHERTVYRVKHKNYTSLPLMDFIEQMENKNNEQEY